MMVKASLRSFCGKLNGLSSLSHSLAGIFCHKSLFLSTFSVLTLKCRCLTVYIFLVSFFWCSVQDKLPPGLSLLFIFNIHLLT